MEMKEQEKEEMAENNVEEKPVETTAGGLMKRIKAFLKSRNMAYFFFCYYLCQLTFCVFVIRSGVIEVGTEIGETLTAFSMLLACILGLDSAVHNFKKPRIGVFEVMAFIGAPIFIVNYLIVIIDVFVNTAIMVYAALIERGII